MDGWNTTFLLGRFILSRAILREGMFEWSQCPWVRPCEGKLKHQELAEGDMVSQLSMKIAWWCPCENPAEQPSMSVMCRFFFSFVDCWMAIFWCVEKGFLQNLYLIQLRFGVYQLIVRLVVKHVYTTVFPHDVSKLMAIAAPTPRILDLEGTSGNCAQER